jgi:predicted DNA-binding protein with PD1-like motif
MVILLQVAMLVACRTTAPIQTQGMKTHVLRLKPGDDVKASLQQFVNREKLAAAWVVTAVGSLTHYEIRTANQNKASVATGHFEILSVTGTLSINGSHLHISIADSTGSCFGGHLLEGNLVYTTAEIVLQSSDDYRFRREKDGSTAWEELQIDHLPLANQPKKTP